MLEYESRLHKIAKWSSRIAVIPAIAVLAVALHEVLVESLAKSAIGAVREPRKLKAKS
jgi:hypothetical protein